MNSVLHTALKDNVLTCLRPLNKGEEVSVDGKTIAVLDNIPQYHKIAFCDIKEGDPIYKYGQVIGKATSDISSGQHLHIHNVESTRGRGDKNKEEHNK